MCFLGENGHQNAQQKHAKAYGSHLKGTGVKWKWFCLIQCRDST